MQPSMNRRKRGSPAMTDKPVNCRCGGNARLEMPDDDSGITNIFCEKCNVALDSFAHDWSSEQLVDHWNKLMDPTADIIAGAKAMLELTKAESLGGAVVPDFTDPKFDPITIAKQVMERRK